MKLTIWVALHSETNEDYIVNMFILLNCLFVRRALDEYQK